MSNNGERPAYPNCLICTNQSRAYAFVFRIDGGSFGICPGCTLKYGREAWKAMETHNGLIVAKIVDLVKPETEVETKPLIITEGM